MGTKVRKFIGLGPGERIRSAQIDPIRIVILIVIGSNNDSLGHYVSFSLCDPLVDQVEDLSSLLNDGRASCKKVDTQDMGGASTNTFGSSRNG